MRRPAARWVLDVLGTKRAGPADPPLARDPLYVREEDGVTRVIASIDDGGFVGIGHPDEWHCIVRLHTARLFAWWVARQWVADWFGLRSALWYRALHRQTSGSWARLGKPHRTYVRPSSWEAYHDERAGSR